MDDSSVCIGLKYCGGCQARHDRMAALRTIREHCSPTTIFEPVKKGVLYDYILVICGCQAQCADLSKLRSNNGIFCVFQWSDNMTAVAVINQLENKKCNSQT